MNHRRAFLLAAASLGLPLHGPEAAQPSPEGSAAPATLPRNSLYQLDLNLTDQDGQMSHWADAARPPGLQSGAPRTSARLVSMFYTRCEMVCPMLFESLRQLELGLPVASRGQLGVALITLDPQRDDVASLQKTAAQRAGDTKRWRLYRTQAGDVRRIANLLGVKYRKLASGEFSHSTPIILLNAQGVELARTEQLVQPEPNFVKTLRMATHAG